MNLTFLELFTLISIVHCFLLGIVVLSSKYLRNNANQYLGFTLLAIAIIGVNNWFWDLNQDPIFVRILDLLLWQFLYPVTLYVFFIKALKRSIVKYHKRLFYLPFIVLSIMNIVVTMHNVYGVIHVPFLTPEVITTFYKIISLLSIVYPLLLLCLSFRLLFILKTNFNIGWLKAFWVLFSFIELYGILLEGHRFLFLERQPLTYLWAVMSILLYWLLYVGVYRFKLSNEKFEIRQKLRTRKPSKILDSDIENDHVLELLRLITKEKLHHNPMLNREMVSEKLGISTGYLSQLISTTNYKNLSELINYYRIEDVKHMLSLDDFSNYSLMSIGFEVGFNSKTTFYNTFKKFTGITPNEFKNQVK